MHTFYIIIVDHPDTDNPYARQGNDGNFSGVGSTPSLFFTKHHAENIIDQYNYKCLQIGGKKCATRIKEVKIDIGTTASDL